MAVSKSVGHTPLQVPGLGTYWKPPRDIQRYPRRIIPCPPSVHLEVWSVPATQLDPGLAIPVSRGTSGQKIDACAKKECFNRMVDVGAWWRHQQRHFTVDQVNARIERPNQSGSQGSRKGTLQHHDDPMRSHRLFAESRTLRKWNSDEKNLELCRFSRSLEDVLRQKGDSW